MKKIVIACLAIVTLAGCEAQYRADMNKFVGQPETALVAALGAPTRAYQAADGSRVLTYFQGETMYAFTAGAALPVKHSCSTNFVISPAHIVRSVTLRGDSCGWM